MPKKPARPQRPSCRLRPKRPGDPVDRIVRMWAKMTEAQRQAVARKLWGDVLAAFGVA